jgi:hypothetical protein
VQKLQLAKETTLLVKGKQISPAAAEELMPAHHSPNGTDKCILIVGRRFRGPNDICTKAREKFALFAVLQQDEQSSTSVDISEADIEVAKLWQRPGFVCSRRQSEKQSGLAQSRQDPEKVLPTLARNAARVDRSGRETMPGILIHRHR